MLPVKPQVFNHVSFLRYICLRRPRTESWWNKWQPSLKEKSLTGQEAPCFCPNNRLGSGSQHRSTSLFHTVKVSPPVFPHRHRQWSFLKWWQPETVVYTGISYSIKEIFLCLSTYFKDFLATFSTGLTWLWLEDSSPHLYKLPGRNRMHHMQTWVAFCCLGASASIFFNDVTHLIYSNVFLSFFIPLQRTRGIFHVLWFSSIEISSIFLNWWSESSSKGRARATQHFMQTWDGWLLSCRSNVDDSATIQKSTVQGCLRFRGCFPVVERL